MCRLIKSYSASLVPRGKPGALSKPGGNHFWPPPRGRAPSMPFQRSAISGRSASHNLEIEDFDERLAAVDPFERGALGRFKMRNDIGIVVRDRIDVIDPTVFWVLHVFVRFASSKEPPSAIEVVVGLFAVHESDRHAGDSDHVCCNACAKAARERSELVGGLCKLLIHAILAEFGALCPIQEQIG